MALLTNLPAAAVAPHAGAWIETSWKPDRHRSNHVAPHAGAWIETIWKRRAGYRKLVAPHAGAWIETNVRVHTSPDGRIAIVVGEGGFHARSFAPLVPELRSQPNRGATIWVFALPD